MIASVTDYFRRLGDEFGQGWTRFWFTPSDAATVSAIRMGVGLIVVYLHATLSFDLVALFGPNGLLPVADIEPLEGGSFSYLNYLVAPGELWAVHLLGLAVLVAFTAGLWTRITSVLALIVFLSDIHRAPMITGPTEPVVAFLMLYLCIAPCGRRYSLDRLLARRADAKQADAWSAQPLTTATIAARLIQLHLALLVGMMAFSQLAGDVWWTGMGMWWLITRQESRLVDFSWLHQYPLAIAAWTHAVVLFELSFATLIWVPLARPLLIALGVLIWGSLALVTGDVPFAASLVVASLAFISPATFVACCGGDAKAT